MYHEKAIKRGVLVSLYNLLNTLFHKINLRETQLQTYLLKPSFKSHTDTKILHNHNKDYGG